MKILIITNHHPFLNNSNECVNYFQELLKGSKEFKIFSLNSWEIIESASIQNLNKEFHQWLKDHN